MNPPEDLGIQNVKDFKVAIIGGGLCGLACAVGLRKAGVKVDIYEAAVRYICLIYPLITVLILRYT